MTIKTLNLISIPFVAALIGWFTNWVAVKMLFHPRKPVKILWMTFQGLVPKRQSELALKIGETVENKLMSLSDIQKIIESDDVKKEIETTIDEQLEKFIRDKLSSIPIFAMFLQGEVVQQIKGLLSSQLRAAVPDLIKKFMGSLESKLSFKDIVREKVEKFDLSTLENIIYDISAKELKTIELLGGVLGFVIGVIQVILLQLT